jgi:hypothetical protein
MLALSACGSAPNRIVTVKKTNCDIVPYIDLNDAEIDGLVANIALHDVIVRIDKQSQIIDLCKQVRPLD